MIVKMQISEYPYNANVLVYSKDKSIYWEQPATNAEKKRLNGRRKAYFNAYVDKKGILNLLDEAPKQSW